STYIVCFFSIHATSPPATYTLSLHDALPIFRAICPNAAFPDIELQERVPNSENIRTDRLSLSLLGDGFVEAVPDQALLDLARGRSEEHTSELQSRFDIVCRLLLEKKKLKICQSKSLLDSKLNTKKEKNIYTIF